MDKYLTSVKFAIAFVLTFIADALGGWDSTLSLLVSLIVADIVTGVIYAVMTKNVSSSQMRLGIVRKMMIFLVIFVACRVDSVLDAFTNGGIVIFGIEFYVRTLFIIYSCLEESISLIENLSKIGVPFPKAIKEILVQVTDCANSSLPKAIIKFIKDKFHMDINDTSGGTETK